MEENPIDDLNAIHPIVQQKSDPVVKVVAELFAKRISNVFGVVIVPETFCHSICVIIDPAGIAANSVAV